MAVISGSPGPDLLFGTNEDDIIEGLGGNDTLSSGNGRDTLLGGSGDDFLFFRRGDILADGGGGIDGIYFDFDAFDTPITLSLAEPSVEQNLLGTVLRNVEFLGSSGGDGSGSPSVGTRGDDVVTGGAYNDLFVASLGNDIIRGGGGNYDRLYGEEGDDLVHGEDGADYVDGGFGDDVLSGGSGYDTLFGGSGADTLIGGEGLDVLGGGSGADVFVFAPGDVGLSYDTRDRVIGFEVGIDKLDLSAFAGANITLVSGAYTRVKIDFDGDLKTDALIQVKYVSGGSLTMDDILL